MVDNNLSGEGREGVERGASAEGPADPNAAVRSRRRRRRRVVLLLFFLGLAVLIVLAPRILSARFVLGYALDRVSNTIRGRVECDGLSLSWGGPCVVRGIALFDDRDRLVARVERLRLSAGLLDLLWSREQLGEIVLSEPTAELLIDETDSVSLLAAIEPVAEAEPEPESAPFPSISAHVRLESGSVRIVRGNERYDVSGLAGSIKLSQSTDIHGELNARLAGESPIELKIDGRELASSGTLSLASAVGTASVAMPASANLGPLVSMLLGSEELSGTGRIDASVQFEPGEIAATIHASGNDILFADSAAALAHPIDAVAGFDVQLVGNALSVRARINGEGLSAEFTADYPIDAGGLSISPSSLVDAALGGDVVALPELRLEGSAEIDLAAIDRALPGVLPLRPGHSLVSGRFITPSLRVNGGSTGSLGLRAELVEVATSSTTGLTKLEPIAIDIDARLPSGSGIVLDRGELRTGFGSVRGEGSLDGLSSRFDTDLAAMTNQLGAVLDLDALGLRDLGLEGRIEGSASVKRRDERVLDTKVDVQARNFTVMTDEGTVRVEQATFNKAGRLTLSEGRFERADVERFQLDVDDRLIVQGSGAYEVADGKLGLDMNVMHAELAYIAKHLRSFDVRALDDTAGSFTGTVAVARTSSETGFTSSGSLTASQLSTGNTLLTDAPVAIEWTDLNRETDGTLSLTSSRVRSSFGQVNANDIRIASGNLAAPAGRLEGWFDITKARNVMNALAGKTPADDLAGRLAFLTVLAPAGSGVRLTGTANATNVSMRVDGQSLTEPSVGLVYDLAVDATAERVTINNGRISTASGNVDLSGTVGDLKTAMNARLRGRFDANWGELTPILHALAPSTADLLTIEGNRSGTFEWEGPLAGLTAAPALRRASASAQVAWERATVTDLQLGAATLSPTLRSGTVSLPPADIPIAGGKVRLAGDVDLLASPPIFRMDGVHPVLSDARVTPELGRELLSRINPIFYELAAADGVVNVSLRDVSVPLDGTATRAASGGGRIETVDMRIAPAGLLAELLTIADVSSEGEMIAAGVRSTNFTIEKGRLGYRDLTLVLPRKIDLRFSGSVGLDGTLDLAVSVPMSRELLRRLGVKKDVARYAETLLDERVEIPITGTREEPILEFVRINTEELLERALKETAEDALRDALDDLLRGKKKNGKRGG